MEEGTYTLIDASGGTVNGPVGPVAVPDGFSGSLSISGGVKLLLTVTRSARGTVVLLR
jgi:hypothetical protein